MKKHSDYTRNDSSFAPAAIPKRESTYVTIDNSDGRQQTLTGLATTHHTYSTISMPKLVTHPIEDTDAESSTENMDVESSRRSSLRRHMILVMNMHLGFICFTREMTQRLTGLERDQNYRL